VQLARPVGTSLIQIKRREIGGIMIVIFFGRSE
jgi:hypothetical protein